MKRKISTRFTSFLQKELTYVDFIVNTLESEMKPYEKKYAMSAKEFLTKFERGELGDDRALFGWYGLVLSAKDWNDTKKEITQTLRVS